MNIGRILLTANIPNFRDKVHIRVSNRRDKADILLAKYPDLRNRDPDLVHRQG